MQPLQFMTLIFTTIGSAADYGSFGKWVLFVVTIICWAAQFGSVGLVGELPTHAFNRGEIRFVIVVVLAIANPSFIYGLATADFRSSPM